jgi:putative PIN family toxin of toxin-antitoxin system
VNAPTRVVFDCNVFFQAMVSVGGPADACFDCAVRGEVDLFCSEYTLAELQEIASRRELRGKFQITDEQVDGFVSLVRRSSTMLESVPMRYSHPIDPDDSHYVNLALEAEARLIVSRDKDLLRLTDRSTREGSAFLARFPELIVLDPPSFIRMVNAKRTN